MTSYCCELPEGITCQKKPNCPCANDAVGYTDDEYFTNAKSYDEMTVDDICDYLEWQSMSLISRFEELFIQKKSMTVERE